MNQDKTSEQYVYCVNCRVYMSIKDFSCKECPKHFYDKLIDRQLESERTKQSGLEQDK